MGEDVHKDKMEVIFRLKELSVALLKALHERRLKELNQLMEARNRVLEEVRAMRDLPPEAVPLLREILIIERASERLAREIKKQLLEAATAPPSLH